MDGNYILVDIMGNATEIDGEIKIGRGKDSDLVLEDTLVSRHHATVWMEGDVLMVRDEDSVNGTFVNDKQIYDPTELKDQDALQVGDVILTVRAPLSESKTVRKAKDKVEDKVKEKAKEKLADMEADEQKAEDPQKQPTSKKAADAKGAAISKQPAEPEKSGQEVTGEDVLAAGGVEPASGGMDAKKVILIALVLVLVACCCIVVVAAGWFITTTVTNSSIIESGLNFTPLFAALAAAI